MCVAISRSLIFERVSNHNLFFLKAFIFFSRGLLLYPKCLVLLIRLEIVRASLTKTLNYPLLQKKLSNFKPRFFRTMFLLLVWFKVADLRVWICISGILFSLFLFNDILQLQSMVPCRSFSVLLCNLKNQFIFLRCPFLLFYGNFFVQHTMRVAFLTLSVLCRLIRIFNDRYLRTFSDWLIKTLADC